MTKTLTKNTEVAGKRPVKSPARQEQSNESTVPFWKAQHGRIQGAAWRHLQEDGKTRYTISVSRSYKDKEDDKWKNVHYFDRKDLDDIRSICHVAEEEILNDTVTEMAVTED